MSAAAYHMSIRNVPRNEVNVLDQDFLVRLTDEKALEHEIAVGKPRLPLRYSCSFI